MMTPAVPSSPSLPATQPSPLEHEQAGPGHHGRRSVSAATTAASKRPAALKRPASESSSAQASISKRRKVTKAGQQEQPFAIRTGSVFLSPELETMPPPPAHKVQEAIDRYQKDNLEVKSGAVHNRGVFLKNSAAQVQLGQVVAIFRGTLIFSRALTDNELVLCDCSKDEQEKHLIWSMTDGKPTLEQRSASYQAHTPTVYYYDKKGQPVTPGIDGIDSHDAISNINSGTEEANTKWREKEYNIDFVACLNPGLIKKTAGEEVILKKRPEPEDYCLLAVARKIIQPGDELLLNYGDSVPRNAYFWKPDRYFFTPLYPWLSVAFSGDGATASVRVNAEGQKHKENLKTMKALCTEKPHKNRPMLYEYLTRLSSQYQNPFSHSPFWSAGDVKYLFERWNIEHYKHTYPLSYLYHCLDDRGRLDNNGLNYLYAYLRHHQVHITLPDKRLDTIDAVIACLKTIMKKPEISSVQEKQKVFQAQINQLETEQCRRMTEGQERQQQLERLREAVMSHLPKLDVYHLERLQEMRSALKELMLHFPTPVELWPEKFRAPATWSSSHIRCLARINEPNARTIDHLDQLTCFRFDTDVYAEAMKKALERKQREGTRLDDLRKTINSGALWTEHSAHQRRMTTHYHIPSVTGIPVQLQGTDNWLELTTEHWSTLGFNETGDPMQACLSQLIKTFTPDSSDAMKALYNSSRYNLWSTDNNLKQAVTGRGLTPKGMNGFKQVKCRELLRHLCHKYQVTPSPDIKQLRWHPIDTLRVCKPDSEDYNTVMRDLLCQAANAGNNKYQIIALLTDEILKPHGSKKTLPEAYRVELPDLPKKHVTWTVNAVNELLEKFQLTLPSKSPKDDLKQLILDLVNLDTDSKNITQLLSRFFSRHPDITEQMATSLHINKGRLSTLTLEALRYIFSFVGIDTESNPKRQELKCKDFDAINLITEHHPAWRWHLVRVIEYFKNRHKSEPDIANLLNIGANYNMYNGPRFDPMRPPEEYRIRSQQWTANIVSRFFEDNQHLLTAPEPTLTALATESGLTHR